MKKIFTLATLASCLILGGCGWLEEQRYKQQHDSEKDLYKLYRHVEQNRLTK